MFPEELQADLGSFSLKILHIFLGNLYHNKLRHCHLVYFSSKENAETSVGERKAIIWTLPVESENFIHGWAEYITIPRTLPTAKSLCLELSAALLHFFLL